MMKKIRNSIILFIFSVIISSPLLIVANSQTNLSAPSFLFPAGCTYDKDCWITVYSDDDPSFVWEDYKGGKRTYNEHDGTDIAIRNIYKMQQGVPVKAAASGIVIATRDGVADVNVKEIGESAVSAYECGNRVGIDHGNGWLTDYCHLRKGSVTVKKGDHVTAGQRIGYIGMSGLAELPHLHFQVYHSKTMVDPFNGRDLKSTAPFNPANVTTKSLWNSIAYQQIKYFPLLVYNTGITKDIPNMLNIQGGKFTTVTITPSTQSIDLWADMFAVEPNDILQFTIINPSGSVVVTKKITIERANVRRFQYIRYTNPSQWQVGTYKIKATLTRPSKSFSYTRADIFKVS